MSGIENGSVSGLSLKSLISVAQALRQDQDTTVSDTTVNIEEAAAETSPEVQQPDTALNTAALLDSLNRIQLELSSRRPWINDNSLSICYQPPFEPPPTAASKKIPLLDDYRRGSDKSVHGPNLSDYPYPTLKTVRELKHLKLKYKKPSILAWLLGTAAIASAGVLAASGEKYMKKEGSRTTAILSFAAGGALSVNETRKLISNRSLDKRIGKAIVWVDAHNEVAEAYNKSIGLRQKEKAVQVELKKDLLAALAECIPLNDGYTTKVIFKQPLKDEISGIKWALQEIQGNEDCGQYMELEEMKAKVAKLTARAREINKYCATQIELFDKFKAEQDSAGKMLRGFDLDCLTTETGMTISALRLELPKFTDPLYFAENKNIGEERIKWDSRAQSVLETARYEQETAKDMWANAEKLLNKYINTLTTSIEKDEARPDFLKLFKKCAKAGNFRELKDKLNKVTKLIARPDPKLGWIEQELQYLQPKENKLFDEQIVSLLGRLVSIADADPSQDISAKIELFRSDVRKEIMWFMLHSFIDGYIKDRQSSGANLKVGKTLLGDQLNPDGTWDLQFVVRDYSATGGPVEKSYDNVRTGYDGDREEWYTESVIESAEDRTWIEFKSYAKYLVKSIKDILKD